MASKDVSIWVRVKDGFSRKLDAAKAKFKSFSGGLVKAAKAASIGFAALGAALIGSIKVYSKQQDAERLLSSALRMTGQDVDSLMDKYKQLASTIQNETAIADEDTLAQIALATQLGVTSDQMEDAIKLTIALGTVGMKGETAIRAASAALAGNTSQLTRYIPALRGAKTEAEKMAIVNDLIATGYAIQSDQLNTVSGRW